MDGLLIKLLIDRGKCPGYWFWLLFSSIKKEFNNYFWVFTYAPWMGAPEEFYDDPFATIPVVLVG